MKSFFDVANEIKDEIIELRRDIHMNPELGFEEKRTSEKIKEYLRMQGIPYTSVANTGVCGIINGEGRNDISRVIALRADMDALPLDEKNDCSYSSKHSGKMHACGHDAHIAILLGAAKILNSMKKSFGGTIKLFFEPAEETVGGSRFMIREGVLDKPNVDVVVGLHVTEDVECGKIRIKKNMVNAASNPFNIVINGKGGHGASPNDTVDPIVIASNVINTVQTLISREVKPTNPVVITFGSIHGGTAQNIIPEQVELKGIIRTTTIEDRKYVVDRFKKIVNGICKTMRGTVKIDIEESYPCLFNDDNLVDLVRKVADKQLGSENVIEQQNPSMGVESFAYFANKKPSVFYYLGTRNEKKGIIHPAHSSFFNIDENAITIGIALQCAIVFEYLTR